MKRLSKSLSALATCFVALFTVSAFADPYDDLRVRWAETLVAAPASVNMSDPVIYDPYATTRLSNASQARSAVISALDWMYANRYQNNRTRYGNWFEWEIGAPQVLLNIVALMWDDLSTTQRGNYTKAVIAKVHPSRDYPTREDRVFPSWAISSMSSTC